MFLSGGIDSSHAAVMSGWLRNRLRPFGGFPERGGKRTRICAVGFRHSRLNHHEIFVSRRFLRDLAEACMAQTTLAHPSSVALYFVAVGMRHVKVLNGRRKRWCRPCPSEDDSESGPGGGIKSWSWKKELLPGRSAECQQSCVKNPALVSAVLARHREHLF